MNPFIELATDPVGTLAWIGYALLLAGLVLAAVPWAIRQAGVLTVRYQKNRTRDSWWSFGDRRAGYIPPLSWLARAFGVVFVLAVTAWAAGALLWLVGIGA